MSREPETGPLDRVRRGAHRLVPRERAEDEARRRLDDIETRLDELLEPAQGLVRAYMAYLRWLTEETGHDYQTDFNVFYLNNPQYRPRYLKD